MVGEETGGGSAALGPEKDRQDSGDRTLVEGVNYRRCI